MDRVFISVAPRQNVSPREGMAPVAYEATDNKRLVCPKSYSFPIINVLNGYIEKGDTVKFLVITADYDTCRSNYEIIIKEAADICDKVGAIFIPVKIDVKFSEKSENHLNIFEQLVEEIHDGDHLNACITYGSKPTPILEIMALNYGYRNCKNVSIDCIVYGELDHQRRDRKNIYDVTSLFYMDQIVNELSINGHANSLRVIQNLLSEV